MSSAWSLSNVPVVGCRNKKVQARTDGPESIERSGGGVSEQRLACQGGGHESIERSGGGVSELSNKRLAALE